MKEGYWVIRTYESGYVGEKTKFWQDGVRPDRLTRQIKSDIKKQEQNKYSAEKQLARLINANCGPGFDLVGLDYSSAGMEQLLSSARKKGLDPGSDSESECMAAIRAAAEHELRKLLRRVCYELNKSGVDLKYIAITSDMDGDTGEDVRVHHHLIVPESARTVFIEKWKALGTVNWKPLSDQADYTRIAAYFISQTRRVPDAKKYTSSRNLIRPVPRDRLAASDAELRVPRGGELLHRNEFKPGRPQYIRYVLPPHKRRRSGMNI